MANLIITIISIALIAVATLMGAYYGGQAFLNAQLKARVNEINNVLDQIAAGVHVYSGLNGVETFPAGATSSNAVSNYLTPTYLQPIPDADIYGGPVIYGFTGTDVAPNIVANRVQIVGIEIWTNDTDALRLCEAFSRMHYGDDNGIVDRFNDDLSLLATQNKICTYEDYDDVGGPMEPT